MCSLHNSSVRIQAQSLHYYKQGLCQDSEATTTNIGGETKFIPTQLEKWVSTKQEKKSRYYNNFQNQNV